MGCDLGTFQALGTQDALVFATAAKEPGVATVLATHEDIGFRFLFLFHIVRLYHFRWLPSSPLPTTLSTVFMASS